MKKNQAEAFGKVIPKKSLPEDLKMKVKEYIDKLNESSTQQYAFTQFKILLQKYNSLEDVKAILPLLLNYTNKNFTKIGKEYQLVLIAYALNINYIKNPNHNIASKILESIGNYLYINSFNLHKAASIAIIELFDLLCENETKDKALEFILKYFFGIIEKNHNIISKINENGILNGSFIIINELLSYVIYNNSSEKVENNNPEQKNEVIERANRRIENENINKASDLNSLQQILIPAMIELLNIFKKYKYPNPNMLQSICNLIDVISYDEYKNNFLEIIHLLINVLYKNDAQIYLSKIEVCEIFNHLKNKLRNLNIEELPNQSEIIKSIEYATKDRVFKVQVCSNNTLNNILNIEENNKIIPKLNLLRNLSKIYNGKNTLMNNKEVRKNIYEVGIGKFLRTTEFLNNRDEENLIQIKKDLENKRKKEISKSKEKKNRQSIKSLIKGQKLKKNENNFKVISKYNPYFSEDEISEKKIKNENNNFSENKENENYSNENNIEEENQRIHENEKNISEKVILKNKNNKNNFNQNLIKKSKTKKEKIKDSTLTESPIKKSLTKIKNNSFKGKKTKNKPPSKKDSLINQVNEKENMEENNENKKEEEEKLNENNEEISDEDNEKKLVNKEEKDFNNEENEESDNNNEDYEENKVNKDKNNENKNDNEENEESDNNKENKINDEEFEENKNSNEEFDENKKINDENDNNNEEYKSDNEENEESENNNKENESINEKSEKIKKEKDNINEENKYNKKENDNFNEESENINKENDNNNEEYDNNNEENDNNNEENDNNNEEYDNNNEEYDNNNKESNNENELNEVEKNKIKNKQSIKSKQSLKKKQDENNNEINLNFEFQENEGNEAVFIQNDEDNNNNLKNKKKLKKEENQNENIFNKKETISKKETIKSNKEKKENNYNKKLRNYQNENSENNSSLKSNELDLNDIQKSKEEEIINSKNNNINNISSENENYLNSNNNSNYSKNKEKKKDEIKINIVQEKITSGEQSFKREDSLINKKIYNNYLNELNFQHSNLSNKYNPNSLYDKLSKRFIKTLNDLSNNLEEEVNNKLDFLNNRINQIKQKLKKIEELKKENLNDTIIEKKNLQNDNSSIWKIILGYLKEENYEKAYFKALNSGDDLIFLRLIFLTGTNHLINIPVNINKKILIRLNQISRCFMIQKQIVNFINESFNLKMINLNFFNENELNDLMQTLYEIGDNENEIGYSARIIYDKIKESIEENNN